MKTRRSPKAQDPRRQQKLHRQEAILSAAFEVFAANGFEAARLDEVAQRAGVAKGTIYLYFRDKEELFQAMVRNLIPKRLDVLVQDLSGPPEAMVHALLDQVYANVVRNPRVKAIVRMLVAESGRFPQLAEIYFREIVGPGVKAMRLALKKGMAGGDFERSELLRFPQIVVAPALLAIMWQSLFGERHPLDLEAYRNSHLGFVRASLRRDWEHGEGKLVARSEKRS